MDTKLDTLSDRIFTPESAERDLGIPAETIYRWIDRGMPYQYDAPKGSEWSYWFTQSALLGWLKNESKSPAGRQAKRLARPPGARSS